MRILLTGGAGFIGSHILEHLVKYTDWEIIVLDSLTYAGDLHRIAHLKDKFKVVYHNLQASFTPEKIFRIGQVDIIIHAAAETHVNNSLKDPVLFAQTNVIGTTNLLEFVRYYQPGLKVFVNVSTDEVYGVAPTGIFYKEWDRIKPSNPYSASKAGQDAMVMAYATSYKIPAIITRTMNNFGERQHPEKYIPMCIRKLLLDEVITVHGKPECIGSRCWLHARNHADGIMFLINNFKPEWIGDIFHIAGDEYTNLEIAQTIAKFMDKTLHYKFLDFHSIHLGHDARYALSSAKIFDLGWKPPVEFYDSLRKTINWTIRHKEWINL